MLQAVQTAIGASHHPMDLCQEGCLKEVGGSVGRMTGSALVSPGSNQVQHILCSENREK